jgi:phage terminase small subunit
VSALVDAEQAEKERLCKQRFANALDESHHLATSDISETVDENDQPIPLKKLPLHVRRAILSVEIEHRTEGRGEDAEHYTVTKIKMHPKQPAIDFIAKVSGKLKDKVEHSGNVGMHIIDPYAEQPAKE